MTIQVDCIIASEASGSISSSWLVSLEASGTSLLSSESCIEFLQQSMYQVLLPNESTSVISASSGHTTEILRGVVYF